MYADVPAPQGSHHAAAPDRADETSDARSDEPSDETSDETADGSSILDTVVLTIDGGDVIAPPDWPLSAEAFASGPWSCVARTGVSLRLDDLADIAESSSAELDAIGVDRLACRPVWADGRLAGVAVAFGDAAEAIDLDPDLTARAPAFDSLTGIASSGGLQDEIDAGDGDAVVLYLDLDGLDHVNETYGSEGGDSVLIEVARRLERSIRTGDRVFRMTGDEFVVVIRGAEELDSIQSAAQLIDELALPYELAGPDGADELVSVTAGVGMCVPSDGTPFDTAILAALNALGEAKLAGRHRLHIVGR